MLNKVWNALMMFLNLIYSVIDLPLRFRNFYIRKARNISQFSKDRIYSDSQAAFYENAVSKIISQESSFKRFRRIYNYREILEHLSYEDGKKYLELINIGKRYTKDDIKKFALNDLVGKPRKFHYEKIGWISPTTLRYVKIATDIESIFKLNQMTKIAEIGAGYGGQISILNSLDEYSKFEYTIFDLTSVQMLVQKYLLNVKPIKVHYGNIEEVNDAKFDLVISNYAFSELPSELQKMYLEKVLVSAKNGYLLMNSGLENVTGRSVGKLSVNFLKSIIPHIEIYPENPLTGPDNYLIIWREQNN
jgi:putative sugar O-methyltransferase